RGVLVVRRARLLDSTRRGRGGLRDRVVGRADTLFGARAPMVDALVIARRTGLDPDVRERYAQAGLAHLLAISGLHVGFIAAWLSVTAVASVIWARRAAERSAWPVRLVAPAVAATILTAPITAFAFGTVAPIGVLANLVAIPLAGVAVPGLVLALALSWLWP